MKRWKNESGLFTMSSRLSCFIPTKKQIAGLTTLAIVGGMLYRNREALKPLLEKGITAGTALREQAPGWLSAKSSELGAGVAALGSWLKSLTATTGQEHTASAIEGMETSLPSGESIVTGVETVEAIEPITEAIAEPSISESVSSTIEPISKSVTRDLDRLLPTDFGRTEIFDIPESQDYYESPGDYSIFR